MENFGNATWIDAKKVKSNTFICWNCGKEIASEIGYEARYQGVGGGIYTKPLIYICHNCFAPNIRNTGNEMMLKPLPGKEIKKLPDNIKCVYNEARACMSVSAYTAAVMLFRKILMNISVEEGAEEGKDFTSYLGYLCKEGFVPRRQTKQAEQVKNLGNDANHKIECRTKEEAEILFKFVEQFLITNYEFADGVEGNDK